MELIKQANNHLKNKDPVEQAIEELKVTEAMSKTYLDDMQVAELADYVNELLTNMKAPSAIDAAYMALENVPDLKLLHIQFSNILCNVLWTLTTKSLSKENLVNPVQRQNKHWTQIGVDEVASYYSKGCIVFPLLHTHFFDLLTDLESQGKLQLIPAAILERFHLNYKRRLAIKYAKYAQKHAA